VRSAIATPPGVTWQMLAERPNIVAIRNYIERMHTYLQVDIDTCCADARENTKYPREDVEAAIRLVKWTRGIS